MSNNNINIENSQNSIIDNNKKEKENNISSYNLSYSIRNPFINILSKNSIPINFSEIEYLTIKEFIGKEAYQPLKIEILNSEIKNFETSKISKKNFGIIKAFAVNSHEGIIRNYNEDKVTLILNINQPENYNVDLKGKWPKVSFFSIFDGHNGKKCAEFLKDNLHNFIINDDNFPNDVPKAILNAFQKAENEFLVNYCLKKDNNKEINNNNKNENENENDNNKDNKDNNKNNKDVNNNNQDINNGNKDINNNNENKTINNDNNDINNENKKININIKNLNSEKSGSCALILITINSKIYIANLGDSRIIMSSKNKKKLVQISKDHKPNEINEKKRITLNGGKIYQSKIPIQNDKKENKILLGPYRINPGGLSVSRTIGDYESKCLNNNIIISIPEIYSFDLEKDNIDFFLLGCDGIFDLLSNNDIFKSIFMVFNYFNQYNLHFKCGKACDYILKASMARKCFDNVTCIIICFKDFQNNNFIDYQLYDEKCNSELNNKITPSDYLKEIIFVKEIKKEKKDYVKNESDFNNEKDNNDENDINNINHENNVNNNVKVNEIEKNNYNTLIEFKNKEDININQKKDDNHNEDNNNIVNTKEENTINNENKNENNIDNKQIINNENNDNIIKDSTEKIKDMNENIKNEINKKEEKEDIMNYDKEIKIEEDKIKENKIEENNIRKNNIEEKTIIDNNSITIENKIKENEKKEHNTRIEEKEKILNNNIENINKDNEIEGIEKEKDKNKKEENIVKRFEYKDLLKNKEYEKKMIYDHIKNFNSDKNPDNSIRKKLKKFIIKGKEEEKENIEKINELYKKNIYSFINSRNFFFQNNNNEIKSTKQSKSNFNFLEIKKKENKIEFQKEKITPSDKKNDNKNNNNMIKLKPLSFNQLQQNIIKETKKNIIQNKNNSNRKYSKILINAENNYKKNIINENIHIKNKSLNFMNNSANRNIKFYSFNNLNNNKEPKILSFQNKNKNIIIKENNNLSPFCYSINRKTFYEKSFQKKKEYDFSKNINSNYKTIINRTNGFLSISIGKNNNKYNDLLLFKLNK